MRGLLLVAMGLVLAFLGLEGCYMKQATPDYSTEVDDSCMVFFYRDAKIGGAAVTFEIYDKGQWIGALRVGSYFAYRAAPGLHEFSAMGEVRSTRSIQCQSGQTFYFQSEAQEGYLTAHATLELRNEDGPAAIKNLRYNTKNKTGTYSTDANYSPSTAKPEPKQKTLPTSAAGTIKEEYDEFKKQSVVSLENMEISKSLLLNAVGVKGLDAVIVVLSSSSKEWKYSKCYGVDWLADDSPVAYQGSPSRSGTVGQGYVNEHISIEFTREQFLALSSGIEVKGRICDDVFLLKEEHLGQMLVFTEKLQLSSSSKLGGSTCGNGLFEKGEQCDRGKRNSDTIADMCRTNCTLPHCGDGIVDSIETCDDGNIADGDGCLASCVVANPNCGNGAVDPGEQCDDGSANSEMGPCLPLCKKKP